jgi:hypothetical protein
MLFSEHLDFPVRFGAEQYPCVTDNVSYKQSV